MRLGSFPLRAYARCIILGIVVALWLPIRRWAARGGDRSAVEDIALWVVPFGIVGGRLYHDRTRGVLRAGRGAAWAYGSSAAGAASPSWPPPTPPHPASRSPRRSGAGATGSNQELYSRATDLPWRLRIDPENCPADGPGQATHHPTFLCESLWNVGGEHDVTETHKIKIGCVHTRSRPSRIIGWSLLWLGLAAIVVNRIEEFSELAVLPGGHSVFYLGGGFAAGAVGLWFGGVIDGRS